MKRSLVILGSLWALAAVAAPQKLGVFYEGKETELSADALDRLGAKPVTLVDGLESTAKKKVKAEYTGYPVAKVLDAAFGDRKTWAKAKDVVFECADGYRARVPAAELARRKGYLVYQRKGDSTFSLTNETQGGKRVNLAPYYLVWDDATMQKPENAGNWPYQVVAVRLEK